MKAKSFLLSVMIGSFMMVGSSSCTRNTEGTQKFLKQWNTAVVTDGDWKQREQKGMEFVLGLDADRLLYHFRDRAGVAQPEGCTTYGGWENTDLRGHSLGHYLTALSIYWMQSGNAEAKQRIDHVVAALRETQTATGSGYISAFGEEMLDNVERDGSGWAPYYTLHKILQGLVDAYSYAQNDTALVAASDMGSYIYQRTTRLTDKELWIRNLDIQEVGGIAEALLNLYEQTKNDEHLKAAQFFQQWDKLLPSFEGRDILNDKRTNNFHHANTAIPQFIAAEREYELTGNDTLLRSAVNFWENVTQHRAYSNGSTSQQEHWNLPPDCLSKELLGLTGETCCTYNLIKLSNDLFRFLRQPKYAEYVERATLNHILGSMNMENGNLMYFHTQLQGSFKTFGRNTDVFWCCTGSGMENHVRYGQSVFFSDADTLYVCQYLPCRLDWTDQQLTIEQITDLTKSESAQLRIAKGNGKAVLKIRVPSWCNGFEINCTRTENRCEVKDGWCIISGEWCEGDVVDISLPMHLRLEPLVDSPTTAALCYGPFVLAADLGNEGVTEEYVNVYDNFYWKFPDFLLPIDSVPSLTGSMECLDWITKTEGALEFTTTATDNGTPLRFIPLYQANFIRFADYMTFK